MFTQDWNIVLNEMLHLLYPIKPTHKMICAEIGSFEGKGSLMIIEHLCNNEHSRLYCIDPWEDCYVKDNEQFSHLNLLFKNQYNTFKENTKNCKKIIELRGYSNEVIDSIEEGIDFAFIDGDHSEKQVYQDGVMMYNKMKHDGIMIFDDYYWSLGDEYTKRGVDRFLEEYKNRIDVLHVDYNVVIRIKKELIFDVYALNWNEEKLLPYFFKHYHQANNIFIYDNNSNDGSKDIIRKNKGHIISFDSHDTINDEIHKNLKNNIWKKSKLCDFVIVQDLDEFLYFPKYPNDIKKGLEEMRKNKVTILKSYGYQMYCSDQEFENIGNRNITSTIINGSRHPFENWYDKVLCFHPSEIIEINYDAGCHSCQPLGNIVYDDKSTLLLHYKYMGKEYSLFRQEQIKKRLSESNKRLGQGWQYNYPERVEMYFNNFSNQEVFRILYPDNNIALIKFNNRKCIIDTFGERDIISNVLLKNYIWEPKVAKYIQQNVNDCTTFIDIGCNIGFHSSIALLSNVCYVYAFECNPKTYSKFNNTIFLNGYKNINLRNIGVSDGKKENYFEEVVGNIGASYIKDTHIGWNGEVRSIGMVECESLEHLIPIDDIHTSNILIKIDVEGHEWNVLKGMNTFLNDSRTKKIIIELNPVITLTNILLNIIEFLINYGFYEMKLLFDISTDDWHGEEVLFFEPTSISYDELKEKIISKNIVEVVFIR